MNTSQTIVALLVAHIFVFLVHTQETPVSNGQTVAQQLSTACQGFSLATSSSPVGGGTISLQLVHIDRSPAISLTLYGDSSLTAQWATATITNEVTQTLQYSISLGTSGVQPVAVACPLVSGNSSVTTTTVYFSYNFYCPLETYALGLQGPCFECPRNAKRLDAMRNNFAQREEQCVCSQGYYRIPANVTLTNHTFACLPCPTGANCLGNAEQPLPRDGYVFLDYRTDDQQLIVLPCPVPEACVHKSTFNLSESWVKCTPGYNGTTCGTCVQGYFKMGDRCYDCVSISAASILIIVWVFILVIVALLLIPLHCCQIHFGAVPIFINFIQISALFPRFHISWPQSVLTFFYIQSVSNLNIELFRPECASDAGFSYYGKFMFTIWIPIIVFLLLVIVMLFVGLCNVIPRFRNLERYKIFLQYCAGSIVSFLLYCYIMETRWTLDLFSCDKLHDSLPLTHSIYPEVLCSLSNSQFATFTVFALISILLTVLGIPAMVALFSLAVCVTRRLKESGKVPKDQWDSSMVKAEQFGHDEYHIPNYVSSRESDETIKGPIKGIEGHAVISRIFGGIYAKYRTEHYFWELVILARKFFICLCFVWLASYPVIATVCVTWTLLVALIAHLAVRPFRKVRHNILEAILLGLQYMMLILALMFFASEQIPHDSARISASYSTILNLIMFLAQGSGLVIGFGFVVYDLTRFAYRVAKMRKSGELWASSGAKIDLSRPADNEQVEMDNSYNNNASPTETRQPQLYQPPEAVENHDSEKGNTLEEGNLHPAPDTSHLPPTAAVVTRTPPPPPPQLQAPYAPYDGEHDYSAD